MDICKHFKEILPLLHCWSSRSQWSAISRSRAIRGGIGLFEWFSHFTLHLHASRSSLFLLSLEQVPHAEVEKFARFSRWCWCCSAGAWRRASTLKGAWKWSWKVNTKDFDLEDGDQNRNVWLLYSRAFDKVRMCVQCKCNPRKAQRHKIKVGEIVISLRGAFSPSLVWSLCRSTQWGTSINDVLSYPLPRLSASLITCLSAKLGYFFTPSPFCADCGRHIWKPIALLTASHLKLCRRTLRYIGKVSLSVLTLLGLSFQLPSAQKADFLSGLPSGVRLKCSYFMRSPVAERRR